MKVTQSFLQNRWGLDLEMELPCLFFLKETQVRLCQRPFKAINSQPRCDIRAAGIARGTVRVVFKPLLNRLKHLAFLRESLARHVKSSLDGSDWGFERIAHLVQALPVQIKCDQRSSIQFP